MAMKICKDCGTEVSKSAKTCPKCGKKLSHTGLRIILGLIIIMIGIGGIVSNTSTPTSSQPEKFTLVDSEGSYDGFAYYITGTITNNTNKEYSYAQVTFNLYDADGAQIGTALANINNLEANGTWKFKAIGGTDKPASYKLAEITGW